MEWLRLFALTFAFTLLIVLLVFMVITPMYSDQPAMIDLPVSRAASKRPAVEHDLAVTVRADGTTYFGAEDLGVVSLGRRLSAARAQRAEPPAIRVWVDRSAPFHRVRQVVIAARNAGFGRVTIMVREESSSEDGRGANH